MVGRLRTLRGDAFMRHNAVLMAGSLLIGFLNYVFYPVMGRLLEPRHFGEVQTLFSVFSHLTITFNVLGLVVVNIVANYAKDKARRLINELERAALLGSGVLFGLFLLLVVPLSRFFHFDSAWPFIGLAVTILIMVPSTFRRSVLHGLQDFKALSWSGILASLLKLVAAVGLVLMGLQTSGTILSVLIAQILTLLYMNRRLKSQTTVFSQTGPLFGRPHLELIRPELRYGGLILIISLAFTLLYTIDILTVKHFFPPDQAGIYAGISTIANIIYFITGSISSVLVASIKIGAGAANRQLLRRSLLLTIGIGGVSLLVFSLTPRTIIGLLMGQAYVSYAHFLPAISVALFLLAIANVLFVYHMALRAYHIGWLAAGGLLLAVILMLVNHTTVQAIIYNVIMSSAALTAGIVLYGWLRSKEGHG